MRNQWSTTALTPAFSTAFGHFHGLVAHDAHGLLQHHVLTGLCAGDGQRMVGVVVGGDVEQINAVVAHDSAGIGGGVATTKLLARALGGRLDHVAERDYLDSECLRGVGMGASHAPAANQCCFQVSHLLLLSIFAADLTPAPSLQGRGVRNRDR